jgi:hypothetical protein
MSDADAELRVGLDWIFPPEQVDEVLDALDRLPQDWCDLCFYPSGRIEFTVETTASSFEAAIQSAVELVVDRVRTVGLPGQLESAFVTDDISYASRDFVDGRLVAPDPPLG